MSLQVHEELLAVGALVEAHHALLPIGRQRQLHLDGALVLLLKHFLRDVRLHVFVEAEAALELLATERTAKVLASRTIMGRLLADLSRLILFLFLTINAARCTEGKKTGAIN